MEEGTNRFWQWLNDISCLINSINAIEINEYRQFVVSGNRHKWKWGWWGKLQLFTSVCRHKRNASLDMIMSENNNKNSSYNSYCQKRLIMSAYNTRNWRSLGDQAKWWEKWVSELNVNLMLTLPWCWPSMVNCSGDYAVVHLGNFRSA